MTEPPVAPDTPTERRVLIALSGDTSPGIAIPEAAFTLPGAGQNGESYEQLGFILLAYEDTREPYVAPPTPPARAARASEQPAASA